MEDYAAVNQIYKLFFSSDPPARTCYGSSSLQTRVSLHLIFSTEAAEINTLHVESISSWAPAMIGPYSQARKLRNTIWLAGMIGLNPATMTLISDNFEDQVEQIITNLKAILEIHFKTELKNYENTVYFKKGLKIEEIITEVKKKGMEIQEAKEVDGLPRNAKIEMDLKVMT